MPLSKKLIVTFGGFMLISLLSACSSWFQPKTKTIEYDEEVKLHDGSMIWVHITRHYVLAGGGALGDTGAFRRHYIPKEVEISWDTGFEGVGRKSVFFDEQVMLIDKYDNKWYVAGVKNRNTSKNLSDSINCDNVGTFIGTNSCMAVIGKNGEFIKINPEEIYYTNIKNILNPIGIKDWGLVPEALNEKKLSWQKKLELQNYQIQRRQFIGKSYLENTKDKQK